MSVPWNKGKTKNMDSRIENYTRQGDKHSQWKGGYRLHKDGYLYIHRTLVEALYESMCGKYPYILYHRYVKAKSLGRPLKNYELVHHIDQNKLNNDLSNLEITTRERHMSDHHGSFIADAKQIVDQLRLEELSNLNQQGIITCQQAADAKGYHYVTIRRRIKNGELTKVATLYNGDCVYQSEVDCLKIRKSPIQS